MWQERLVFNLANGTTLIVTQANIWQGGLTIEQSVSSDGFFEIGSTHIGQMTVALYNSQRDVLENADFSLNNEGHLILEGEPVTYDVVYDTVDFQNAVVTVSMAKDSDTLQQMGVYTVVRSERDNGILGITAYDNMTLLSEPYTTALSFPSTYGAMVQEITGRTIQFDGSTTAVQTAPEFEAETTKREVLGYIAQACGYNVKCNSSGYIEFVRYNMSGFNTSGAYHEISSLFDFHHSHYPVVITGAKVIVRTTVTTTDPDTGETTAEEVVSEYTSGTDDYQIVIEGNPLITTANGQAVANTIFATFGGVEFYTGSVTHLSDLSIKASDIMKVTDRTGTTYPMLVSSTVISTGSPQISQSFSEEPASKLSVQPSIIDRVQTSVRQALLDAQNSMNKANHASQIAGNTNQYFWHTETGSDTGAHITEIPREDFLDDPTNGGGNLLARSNGIAVRDGLTELSTFSANGCYLGNETTSRLRLNNVGISGMTDTGVETFKIITGDYSGTSVITETTGIIENTSSDKTTMSAFYNAKHSPSSAADVVFDLGIVVEYGGETKSGDMQVDYRYDPNNIYIQSFGADKVMMFQSSYVTVHIEGSYQTNRVGISFDITVNNLQAKIQNAQVSVTMPIPDPVLPSYTFGTRLGATGPYSFTEGDEITASGYASHAEGTRTTASGRASHAEGHSTSATGDTSTIDGAAQVAPSHAEGYQTNATSGAAHAEGQGTTASGDASHSEGYRTTASGAGAHAEGVWTEASGKASHAGGSGTKASSDYQTAIGKYNVEDTNDEYAFIIGNGTGNNARSNAFTVDWDGFVMAKPKAFTPTWESGQAPANSHCVVSAGLCSLFYQGTGGVHSNQTLLGTLPVGARPKSLVFCPCVKGANAYGMVQIDTDGKIYLGYISSASVTARLYFNCSFPVV